MPALNATLLTLLELVNHPAHASALMTVRFVGMGLHGSVPGGADFSNTWCAVHPDGDVCTRGCSVSARPPSDANADMCRAGARRLQSVSLGGNSLTGTLHPSWAMLQQLRMLDLSNNSLQGSLPEEWAAFTATPISINVSFNGLYGTLPAWLSSGSDSNVALPMLLQGLDASNNGLSG
jgi:hypothetical protein